MSRTLVSIVIAVSVAFFVSLGMAAEPSLKPVPDPLTQSAAPASKAAPPRPSMAPEGGVPRFYGSSPYATQPGYGPSHSAFATPPRPDAGKQVRVVIRLKNLPATDAAKAINEFLQSETQPRPPHPTPFPASAASVKIVAEPVSNSLLIGGRPEMVDEVKRIASDLDVPQPAVSIEVVIGEAPAAKAKPAEGPKPDRAAAAPPGAGPVRLMAQPPPMETIARVRLTTLDNQAAFVQVGQRIPHFGSVYTAGTGGKEKQPGLTNLGLIVGVTPRVSPDGPIFMEIDVEKSQLGPEQEGVPIAVAGSQVVRAPRIETTLMQTTVRAADGQTIVLGSVAARGKQDKELVIVLTPHIVDGEKVRKPK